MKRTLALLLVGFAILLGFVMRHPGSETTAPVVPPPSSQTKSAASPSPAPVIAKRVSSRETPPASDEERGRAFERINESVSTYDPAAVPAIAAFLTDPDREIRTAAREGLIQLGEPGGIAALRLAATRMSDPSETNACREAADFLDQPSWSETAEARELVDELRRNAQPADTSR